MRSLIVLLACTSVAVAAEAPDYNRDVAPLLQKYCVACHGADDPEKGVVLETHAALLKGGESGAAIVPGSSEKSRLAQMLTGKAKPAMPPKDSDQLSADEIAVIVRWIDAGAPAPTSEPIEPKKLVTPKIKTIVPARRAITAAAFSPDGKLLALAGYGEVQLIDPLSRTLVRRIGELTGSVTNVAFSTDGKRLAVASGEPSMAGEATLWNVADGTLVRRFAGHKDSLYAVALSPDGKQLATGSYDQRIILWDVASGKELRSFIGHNGAIYDLAFHPTRPILASASGDRTVKLWDVKTGARLDTLSQPLKDQYTLAFSSDGKHLAAGGVDNRIRVWALSDTAAENTNPLVVTRFAHEGAVLRLAYSRDGKTLASSGEDRSVRLWNTKQYTETRQLEKQSDWPQALAIAPDSKSVAVARLDGAWNLYDTMTGKLVEPPKPELLAIEPRGIERGTPVMLKLSGKNLAAATSAKIKGLSPKANGSKIELLPFDPARPTERVCRVMVGAKVPRGTYMLSLAGNSGATVELPVYIDDLPQVVEHEPNDDHRRAMPLDEMPRGLWGVIDRPGDGDHYAFEAKAGQTIVFELMAKRIGSELNATLTLLDPAGEVIASNNDFDGQNDPLIGYTFPTAGRYTVRVQDLLAMGSPKSFYRLTVGAFPYVTGVYPLSVTTAKEATVELVGYNLPAEAKSVKFAATAAGEVAVPIDAERYRTLRDFKALVSNEPELLEAEPNGDPKHATRLPTIAGAGGANVDGRIMPGGKSREDVDLFRFDARKGQELVIETMASRRGSPVDTKIEVLDAAGKPVERALLQAVLDSYVTFRPITSDAPAVRVKNWEEMELNEYMYLQGEVCKIFQMPQGPDSGFQFYSMNGKRRTYFDTSATAHPLDEPCYIVEAHPPGTMLTPNGLPQHKLFYTNDDEGQRGLGSDSRLTFTAPADGSYLVRVSDVRGFSGDRFAYRLTVRPRKPDFQVRLASARATVNAGSGTALAFRAERIDGYDEDIRVDLRGVPEGFTVTSPIVIQAGHNDAQSVLTVGAGMDKAAKDADWSKVKITATAMLDGKEMTKEVNSITKVTVAEAPSLRVFLEPAEVTIAPGTTTPAKLRIERNGFDGPVAFDVDNLPHGVIVDNIGLNGILIPAGQSEREIFLKAARWVPETDRTCFAATKAARGTKNSPGPQASPPLMLHVRPPNTLARGGDEQ
ncbi:MAG TPA: pre-peptidase C-terminal domain-containing protein [Pirellulales bacterium]|jgi:WD40 repeat protein|nr:pre-peptidase C-terminal domain-containing protein [Pirellulales bacterium]